MENRDRVPVLLSLGSINADFQVRVERRPEISETLVATGFLRLGGGKAANVAFLARKLGIDARLFGQVGDDDLAEQALRPLRAAGVALAGVGHAAGCATGFAMITVPPDGRKGIVLAPNANLRWCAEDIARVLEALRAAAPGSVLVADCEVAPQAARQALETARACGLAVLLDPSPARQVDDALLALADVAVPNAGEAHALTGIECRDAPSALRAAARLRERGARAACVKLPGGGCVLDDGERRLQVAPPQVAVVDTTGAGDAFAAAFAVALLERRSHDDAARFAVAASSLAVTGYGSQPAYPSRTRIEQLARQLRCADDGR